MADTRLADYVRKLRAMQDDPASTFRDFRRLNGYLKDDPAWGLLPVPADSPLRSWKSTGYLMGTLDEALWGMLVAGVLEAMAKPSPVPGFDQVGSLKALAGVS